MSKGLLVGASALCASSLLTVGCMSAAGATTPSSGKPPIVIGLIASLSGSGSSSFADSSAGAEARIREQNAHGGVDGRMLKLVAEDDQSSVATSATAAKDLIANKGAFGVIDASAFGFGAAPYLHGQGIPVTGIDYDGGPEWVTDSNMFSYAPPASSSIDGKYYSYVSGIAGFLKSQGVTRMAGLSYGIAPSSQNASNSLLAALDQIGVKTCYNNTSVPFGTADFTADTLAIKQAGCNGVYSAFVESSNIALAQEVKNAGIRAKQLYVTGYDQQVLNDPAAKRGLEGAYVTSAFNFVDPTGPTKTMLATLAKYDRNFHLGDVPDIGLTANYIGADLMIYGLEHAGKNPTRQSFITNLRKVGNYDAGGLLAASPVTFTNFGTPKMLPKTQCSYIVQLRAGKFVLADGGRLVCSKLGTY